jgi:peptidoglycan/xylan/chitin deacetylase (PgdA/CDA1 family)
MLELPVQPDTIDAMLNTVLGEGQFGPDHWRLSAAKRFYYILKPAIPRTIIRLLRRAYSQGQRGEFPLGWPIEPRYVRFQMEIMRQLLLLRGESSISFRHFWPKGHRFAFVLTHDIELGSGQSYVRALADLEESLGFRSSFNFVPERYRLDYALMDELRQRGFEIAVHGLKHDGKEFSSHDEFMRRVEPINRYIKQFNSAGFCAPLTHRHPEWMQALDIEYDRSFFDTDPYEPNPGGVMNIWPYMIGHFVELPYTMAQDYTMSAILGQTTPNIWLQKLAFIKQSYGMALVNTHPDYLKDESVWKIYEDFLNAMKDTEGYWHALPRDVARWWRARAETPTNGAVSGMTISKICLDGDHIVIETGGLDEDEPFVSRSQLA